MKTILTTILGSLLGFPLIADAQWRMPETIILHSSVGAFDGSRLHPVEVDGTGSIDILEVYKGEWFTMMIPIKVNSDGTYCRDMGLFIFEPTSDYEIRDIDKDGKDDVIVKITNDMSRGVSTRVFPLNGWNWCR